MELDVSKLNKEIGKLDTQLADPDLFTTSPEKGVKISKQRADALKKLQNTEEAWLKLSDDYEREMSSVA